MTGRWQSYLEGPRWAFGVNTIYDFAMSSGCAVEAVSEHKGWLTKTTTFTVTGSQSALARMQRSINAAVREWNRG